jgi:hypothetical protein
MRAGPVLRISPVSTSGIQYLRLRWRQAGFSSFAYRLAHLDAARPAVIGTLSLVFFFS